jgi:hypothetical protein
VWHQKPPCSVRMAAPESFYPWKRRCCRIAPCRPRSRYILPVNDSHCGAGATTRAALRMLRASVGAESDRSGIS